MSETGKEKTKKFNIPTRKLCGMAVLTALAVVFACAIRIPYFAAPFLEYSPSDVPVLIASFMYGPVAGLIITILVSLIQGFTVSASSGLIGIAMNFLSTSAFVLVAGVIYKFKRNLKGAIISLVAGFVFGVVVMILWNILITPYFMGVERSVVVTMIPTVILPFNLLKYAGNAALTFVLYKATGKFFKFAFKKIPDKTLKQDEENANIDENEEISSNDVEKVGFVENIADMTAQNAIVGRFESNSVDDTYALAKRIADTLEGNETIILSGDLGAGKTTFTKGLALALGVKEELTSPTFTIMNVYNSGRVRLNHLDMYRLESSDDLYEVGVEDEIDDGVTVIEWNKFDNLNGKIINIDISTDGDVRIFDIKTEIK